MTDKEIIVCDKNGITKEGIEWLLTEANKDDWDFIKKEDYEYIMKESK